MAQRLAVTLPPGVEHGWPTTYSYLRCRCPTCTAAHVRYQGQLRRRRYARRVLIGDRLVAAHLPAAWHGRRSTYNNWGCRCAPCTDAHRVDQAAYKERRRRNRRST